MKRPLLILITLALLMPYKQINKKKLFKKETPQYKIHSHSKLKQ